MPKRAVFLDRDKTIIADPGYIDDPDLVSLLPGAAQGIVRLNRAGFAVVVVSNQSGVARGKVTEEQLGEIHERLREMLLEQGAKLDAIYYCPYLDGPAAVIERYRKDSELRKPNPGMLLRAAEELDISLPESWMIGDSARDVIAGERAGCRTILIRHGDDAVSEKSCEPDAVVASLTEAVDIVLEPGGEGGKMRKWERDTATIAERVESVENAEEEASPEETEPTVMPTAPMQRASMTTRDREENVAAEALANGSDLRSDDQTAVLLTEIRDTLKRSERARRYEDFSVARLVGTVAQMLALVAGAWGVTGLFGGSADSLARLSLAILLQLIALTAVLGGGRR